MELVKMDNEAIIRQAEYWLKETVAIADEPQPEPKPEPLWKTAYDWLDGKQPWQVTKAEFMRLAPPDLKNPDILHRHAVQDANISEQWKEIPAEVLADYPEPAPEPKAAEVAFKEGDRVQWVDRKEGPQTGAVTKDFVEGDDDVRVSWDNVAAPGGVPIGRIGHISPERLSHWDGQAATAEPAPEPLDPVTQDAIDDGDGSIEEKVEFLKEASGINKPDIDDIAKQYAELVRTEDPMVLKDIIANRLDGKAKARRKRLQCAGLLNSDSEPTKEGAAIQSFLYNKRGFLCKNDVRLEPVAVKPTKFAEHYDPKGIDDIDHVARSVTQMYYNDDKKTRYRLDVTHVTKEHIEATDGRGFIRVPGTPNDTSERHVALGEVGGTEGQFPILDDVTPSADKEDFIATIDVAKEARVAEGMRESVVLTDPEGTLVKINEKFACRIKEYKRVLKAAKRLGLKQLDLYIHDPRQAFLFVEHGVDKPVIFVFMPVDGDGNCHHYIVDYNAAESQPQPEPKKEEPMPIVDFHKAKATVAKPKPQPKPVEPKVTPIAEAQPEPDSGELSIAELLEIQALASSMIAKGV